MEKFIVGLVLALGLLTLLILTLFAGGPGVAALSMLVLALVAGGAIIVADISAADNYDL